jgi:hypothetical protein
VTIPFFFFLFLLKPPSPSLLYHLLYNTPHLASIFRRVLYTCPSVFFSFRRLKLKPPTCASLSFHLDSYRSTR